MTTFPSLRTVFLMVVLVGCLGSPAAFGRQQPSASAAHADREQAAMDRALHEFRLRAKRGAMDELSKSRDALIALRGQVTSFGSRLEDLRTNDDGKRLAADPAAVAAIFHREMARPVASVEQLDARTAGIDQSLGTLNSADDAALEETLLAVRDLPFETRAWVALRSAELAERSRWFDAALQQAPTVPDPASAPTLAAALDTYALEFDRWSVENFRKGTELAKEEKQQEFVERGRLAALLQAEQRLRQMEEQSRVQLEEERVLHRAEVEKKLDEIARMDRENSALRAQRALEDSKAATASSAVLNEAERDARGKSFKGVEKKPMSLNAISFAGALRSDQAGYLALVRIANDQDNDRPHWPIEWIGGRTFDRATEAQREQVRQAQKLLNELGPTLVELGMLSE